MRFFNLFVVLCAGTILSACHYQEHSDIRPYLEEAKMPHNMQWEDESWTPQSWIDDRGGEVALMDGFYKDGIVTDQFTKKDTPVLEVGRTFMSLSAPDKRKVLATVDYIFGMTQAGKGMFSIQDHDSGKVIGIYTKQGVQFQ